MTFTGHIRDGAVVFDSPVPLPNGTAVNVTPAAAEVVPQAGRPKTLVERWAGIAGLTVDLPADAAAQHDHYLYGTPKR